MIIREERPIKADADGHTVFNPELSVEIMFFRNAVIEVISRNLKEDGYSEILTLKNSVE